MIWLVQIMINNNRRYLIYDASCAFCTGLAGYFNRKWKVKIVPNDKKIKNLDMNKIRRDVHFYDFDVKQNKYILFSGCEAAVRIIGTKYPMVINIYRIPIIRQLIKVFYWFIKKIRKYL